ncbi:hypothetical protein VP01_626g2 [Puccinia sorghi]|uniref:Uncharacterized protein n=1 Tax=Puccinia sorghi TaxID=27349 RepID=A0A0L6UGF3_9BASI|nr:hypothetical protein VP01_626g2 [Puccinia sorghi]
MVFLSTPDPQPQGGHTEKKNLLNFLQLTCSMLQPSCHQNSTSLHIVVEFLVENGWSNNRSILGLSHVNCRQLSNTGSLIIDVGMGFFSSDTIHQTDYLNSFTLNLISLGEFHHPHYILVFGHYQVMSPHCIIIPDFLAKVTYLVMSSQVDSHMYQTYHLHFKDLILIVHRVRDLELSIILQSTVQNPRTPEPIFLSLEPTITLLWEWNYLPVHPTISTSHLWIPLENPNFCLTTVILHCLQHVWLPKFNLHVVTNNLMMEKQLQLATPKFLSSISIDFCSIKYFLSIIYYNNLALICRHTFLQMAQTFLLCQLKLGILSCLSLWSIPIFLMISL